MKVLFVCSGNPEFGISPIVRNQGESLRNNGVELDYFTIKGKGFKGYLKNVLMLKSFLKSNKYDIIHAHYSLSAIVASLAGAKPLIVSLMGSDIQARLFWRLIIKLLSKTHWKAIIVKSERMRKQIGISDALVIPNGVDFEKFKPIKKNIAKRKIKFNEKKHIIFVSNPERYEKNFQLSKTAYNLFDIKNAELNIVHDVDHDLMPYYYSGADVLVVTSLWEGSPNVIKEAMACNCPIVSTDVGDVKEVIGNTEGCYITSLDPKDVAEKIKMVLAFGKMTNGRERIIKLGLDSDEIAKKIIDVYKEVLYKQ